MTHVDPQPSSGPAPPFEAGTGQALPGAGTGPVRLSSLARQEPGATSDVDLLVDFAAGATLFDLVGLGLFLEEKLGCPVDVVPRRALPREIRDEALSQTVPV
jgi:predicted nucleotidyltransferase